MILPWFGGSAAVWITCMLFFQCALLLGYLYAHLLAQRLGVRSQALVHVLLAAGGLLLLPVGPAAAWKPLGPEDPILHILALLAASIGLPYVVLSATSPLLQAWYARRNAAGLPYRLFALSNLASLLGLVAYPFLVEPNLTLGAQSRLWSAGYALFVLLTLAAAAAGLRRGGRGAVAGAGRAGRGAGADGRGPGAVARVVRLRGRAAPVRHQPPDPERRPGAVSLDPAARPLPAELHPLLQPRAGLHPLDLPRPDRDRAGRDELRDPALQLDHAPGAGARGLLRLPLRRLHVLPRGVVAPQALPPPPDGLLPDDRARRRARRGARGGGGAAALPRHPRAAAGGRGLRRAAGLRPPPRGSREPGARGRDRPGRSRR